LGPDWLVTGKEKFASDQAIQQRGWRRAATERRNRNAAALP
jgi:hypothetical protein